MVQAVEKIIDLRAVAGKQFADAPVNGEDIRFGVHAAGDAGLVGDDDGFESVLFEQLQRFGNSGDNDDLTGIGEVVHFNVDHAVAVEEKCFVHRITRSKVARIKNIPHRHVAGRRDGQTRLL